MSIRSRSPRRIAFESELERTAPIKKKLIRFLPPTASTTVQHRLGFDPFASGQSGLYASGMASTSTFYFWCDIQAGRGIYSQGGQYQHIMRDLGKIEVGDATAFCKIEQVDHNGVMFWPRADTGLTLPDLLIDRDGTQYYVVKSLVLNVGDEDVGRMLTLNAGWPTTRER